jgi:Fe(3+) dicitrate transport protein
MTLTKSLSSLIRSRGSAALIAIGFSLVGRPVRAQVPTRNVPETPRLEVTGQPLASPTPWDDRKAKLDHIMSEVSGTEITVTKKATVIKLDQQPPIQNNNLQEQFTKAPGLIVSEQQNPGQFNFSYRGLGNPQESEYTLFLQDGLPLMSDWSGFPTLY